MTQLASSHLLLKLFYGWKRIWNSLYQRKRESSTSNIIVKTFILESCLGLLYG